VHVEPVTLRGERVTLEPLELAHAPELLEASRDESIWRYMPCAGPPGLVEMEAFVREALEAQRARTQLPFAVRRLDTQRVCGSTRFLDLRPEHRGLEIGWTWLARDAQRTAVNTECKLLLLAHAFDVLGALRVQLKTDLRNTSSQRAIERLGAVLEGVLRSHMVVRDGCVRDSVMYSLTRAEWPATRERLRQGLDARASER
jgi:N-acetyltransferase